MKFNVLIDFGESFTDENGSFYCGTTEEQKDNAVKINKFADKTIYLVDVHTKNSLEFVANGGLYPAHNLLNKDNNKIKELGVEGKSVSPQLTKKLLNIVSNKSSGLIVPRHVFFQNYDGNPNFKPDFNIQDVVETFNVPLLNVQDYLDGKIDYVINAKHMFDGTRTQVTNYLKKFPNIPDEEKNIFSIIKEKYGAGEELTFDVTGVVMGICVYQTASGIKQIFPKAKVNIISDASTHLIYAPLGFANEKDANESGKRMCAQIGINYLTTKEYLNGEYNERN
jgi:hypothetical protein